MELISRLALRVVINGTKSFVMVPPTLAPSVSVAIVTAPSGVVTTKSLVLAAVLPPTVTEIFPVVAPTGTVVVMLVVVLALTLAAVPLNLTVLFAGVVLKSVPVIVTVFPTGPLKGVKLMMVGGGTIVTVKSATLVAVLPTTVTVIFPVVAPEGTDVVMLVAVLAITPAVVPLNLTVLLAGTVLKFVPVMVTVLPIGPLDGVKLVMVGGKRAVTVKSATLVAVLPPTVTEIFPVVAPEGTDVVMLVAVLVITLATIPLNLTVLLFGVVLKFVPVIVTALPTGPLNGVKLVMVGSTLVTVKFVALVAVLAPIVTVIFPVVEPEGTDVVILVAVLAVTVAVVPLNFTVLLAGVVLKFVPVMVTVLPISPLVGVKEVMVGNTLAPTVK